MTLSVTTERPRAVASCPSGSLLWKRPVVLIGMAALVLTGLALNWNWLVAAGALPILIGVLPCLAMCGLHLCSMRKNKESDSDGGSRPAVVQPRLNQ